jgi:hypothetical protein
MPDPAPVPRRVQEHIDEAGANYRRYEQMLRAPENVPWATVFLFYSALHLIQAYARYRTRHWIPRDHEERANYVAEYMPLDIAFHYTKLYRASKLARYSMIKYTVAEVRSLHDDQFAKIRRHLREQGVAWQSQSTEKVMDRPTPE